MRKRKATTIFCLVLSPLLCLESSFAQSSPTSSRGRLEDGRAYRVGKDGFRLVDEIAELQVSNDDLRRQVATLEAELDQVQKKSPTSAPLPIARSGPTPSCDELVSSLYLRISRLESQQELAREGGGLPPASVCDFASVRNPYKGQAESLESRVGQLTQEVERLSEQLVTRNEEIAAKERQLLAANPSSASGSSVAASQYQAQIKELETELASLRSAQSHSASAQSTARARMASAEPGTSMGQTMGHTIAPSSNTTSVSSVDVAQMGLRSRLQSINSLIGKRKSLYDKLRKSKGMTTLQLQRLETKRGMSLDSIRRQVNRMSNDSQAAQISAHISEIESLLKQDIRTLSRYLQ